MDNHQPTRIVTLKDLWEILSSHIIPILLSAVLCVGVLFGYQRLLNIPKYNSTATVYILRQENSGDYVYTQSDFTLALNVVNDCTYMIKSHAVLDEVIQELGLQMSYDSLYRSISTRNPDNTRVLEISVESPDAAESKRIVDCICDIASEKITAAMGMDQLTVYSYGTLETAPCNSISPTVFVLAGMLAAVAVYAIYLLAFALDDRIKDEEDVRRYLGLSVLGDIPRVGSGKRRDRYRGDDSYGVCRARGDSK